MVKKKLFYWFYIFFWQFYLTNLRGEDYLPNLTNNQEPNLVFFGTLELEPLEKKMTGACAPLEKNQEPEPLEKKARSWSQSHLKICRLPALTDNIIIIKVSDAKLIKIW